MKRWTSEQMDKQTSVLIRLGFVSPTSQQLLMENSVIRECPKNEVLFLEGGRNSNEYILLEGVLRRLNTTEKGEEVTTGFYQGPAVVTPHFARTIQQKSLFSLEAITDCEVVEIPVAAFDHLRYTVEEFRVFGQRVMEGELIRNMITDTAYRSSDAKERLAMLRTMYPNLENLVPHSFIASYLGITKVSFSRIRKELTGK